MHVRLTPAVAFRSSGIPIILSVLLLLAATPLLFGQQQQQQGGPGVAPPKKSDPAPASAYIEDGGVSVEPFYWLTSSAPKLRPGATALTTTPGDLDYPGKAKGSYGVVFSLPAGRENSLRISYFRTTGTAATTVQKDLALFSVGYNTGDILATDYKLQNVKASWDFLSYTFHNNVRLKTLWEVQGTLIETNLDAPLKPTTTDVTSYAATGRKWLLYPTFGLEFEQAASKHFRWEAKGSGFGIPKRGAIGDAEASAVIRLGKVEVLGGYKFFTIKTSPRSDAYFTQRLSGPYVGLRWYFDRMK